MKQAFLLIKNKDFETKILIQTIRFIKTSDVTSMVFDMNNSIYTIKKPLSVISGYLPVNFFQVNRSCIINLNEVLTVKINDRKIILKNFSEYKVSARRVKALKDALNRNKIFC